MDYNIYKKLIREIQDFPIKGVNFKDITPLLENGKAFHDCIDGLFSFFKDKKVQKIVGIDARGFLFAAPVAHLLEAGVVMVRKHGKLPHHTIVREVSLEYGRTVMEIHVDAIQPGERVAIIDDVLATGGTANTVVDLVKALKGEIVGLGFLVELTHFKGRDKLSDQNIRSLIIY